MARFFSISESGISSDNKLYNIDHIVSIDFNDPNVEISFSDGNSESFMFRNSDQLDSFKKFIYEDKIGYFFTY